MSFDFGDIVLVPFPFTDQTTTKKRPAVVVSSNAYQDRRPDIVVMAVTSQVKSSLFYGELVISQWEKAGLVKPSMIKPVLATIHKKLVLRKRGKLDDVDLDALKLLLGQILG